jgi:hypothetical protein
MTLPRQCRFASFSPQRPQGAGRIRNAAKAATAALGAEKHLGRPGVFHNRSFEWL